MKRRAALSGICQAGLAAMLVQTCDAGSAKSGTAFWGGGLHTWSQAEVGRSRITPAVFGVVFCFAVGVSGMTGSLWNLLVKSTPSSRKCCGTGLFNLHETSRSIIRDLPGANCRDAISGL
ncbi:hypothetical protein [Cyclonatronum proteinivorum]|uniref:hypothetical protein n=1 Tax=Cyclonatronum proteinivorum TaxID=1457365 RepID=UPI000F549A34|nr:hypothetical protein [Cyclonatronum proteinivorum]